jgi:hypothetical protein
MAATPADVPVAFSSDYAKAIVRKQKKLPSALVGTSWTSPNGQLNPSEPPQYATYPEPWMHFIRKPSIWILMGIHSNASEYSASSGIGYRKYRMLAHGQMCAVYVMSIKNVVGTTSHTIVGGYVMDAARDVIPSLHALPGAHAVCIPQAI